MTDFESWSKESLVMFARDANERMREQKAEIEELQQDLKAALAAYRQAVTASAIAASQLKVTSPHPSPSHTS